MPQGEHLLRRNYLPVDLEPGLKSAGIDRTVIVQAHQSVDETRWLLAMADKIEFVAGVVGWVDLTDDRLSETLDDLQQNPYFSGVRHIWHDEHDPAWILRADVVRGLGELAERGIPYDLLARPIHLPLIEPLLDQIPDLKTVVDHIGKPLIHERALEPWLTDLRLVAQIPNVWCKLSGMVTEADMENWTVDDLQPYAGYVLEMFGADRLMFGSDWPVSLQAASYERVVGSTYEALGPIKEIDRIKIFGANALDFYSLE